MMVEYTFKSGSFFFNVLGESDKKAVILARQALRESFPSKVQDHLDIDLTAGAYKGRLYIIPAEITIKNICRRTPVPESGSF